MIKNTYNIDFLEYAPILDEHGIKYKENGNWLFVGTPVFDDNYIFFISSRSLETIRLLRSILPLLDGAGVPFTLIKNQLLNYQVNGGLFGFHEVGKIITVFTASKEQAIYIADKLIPLTNVHNGISVNDGLRIGEVAYICYSRLMQRDSSGNIKVKFIKPKYSNLPFEVDKKYINLSLKNKIVGSCFLPVTLIHNVAKGQVYKGIKFKPFNSMNFISSFFSLEQCLIKIGYANAMDDQEGRDISTRMGWEVFVAKELYNKIKVPKVISFFQERGNSYLIYEWMKGKKLQDKLIELRNKMKWTEFSIELKNIFLSYYLKVLFLIGGLHSEGYVHRDISAANFMVLKNGELCLLDFEFAYSLKLNAPNPPFVIGTLGYVAPEQFELRTPTIFEDIYSLGALLIYLLSGISPDRFFEANKENLSQAIEQITDGTVFFKIIMQCIESVPESRPFISDIEKYVLDYLKVINSENVTRIDTKNPFILKSNL
jgi:serine/threonine protein kinase